MENGKRAWAEGIMDYVRNDPRDFVRCRDGHAVSDLKDLIVTAGDIYADRIAYLQKWTPKGEFESITYKEVLADVNATGTALMKRGMTGKRIAVIGPNCYQWCLSYLAVTAGTGCIVPLDKELNKEELTNQLIRADVEGIFFDKKHAKTFLEIRESGETSLELLVNYDIDEDQDGMVSWKTLISEGNKLIEDGDRSYLDAEVDADIMSVLLFTSGTTGTPKGVMLSQKNLCAELMIAPTIFEFTEDDRYLSFLPLHHTYECTCCFLMAIYKGSSVAFCQGLQYITKNFQEVHPTMMLGVPALYEKLYHMIWKNVRKKGKEKTLKRAIKINRFTKKFGIDLGDKFFGEIRDVFGGRMKTMICGGAKVDPEVLDGLRDFGFNALQGYGLTEAAPMGAFNPQYAPDSRSIGVPFPSQEIKAVDMNDEGIGELLIKGPNLMLGYFNDPEETAKVIDEDGWFHTGDLGYVKDGRAYITGRAKNVIITKNGKNVYPEVLEYYLGLVPFIQESFVFEDKQARKDDTCIAAAIKVDEEEVKLVLGEEYTDDDVRKLLQDEVHKLNADAPAYRRISKVILRKSEFIHNTSQKLIRFAEENKAENM